MSPNDVTHAPVDDNINLSDEQLESLEATFRIFDIDGSGKIEFSSLCEIFSSFGSHLTESELAALTQNAAKNGKDGISFDEFRDLCQTFDLLSPKNKDVGKAFQLLDENAKGFLTEDDLRRMLRKLGHNPSDDEVRELMREADLDNDGIIDMRDFATVFSTEISDRISISQDQDVIRPGSNAGQSSTTPDRDVFQEQSSYRRRRKLRRSSGLRQILCSCWLQSSNPGQLV